MPCPSMPGFLTRHRSCVRPRPPVPPLDLTKKRSMNVFTIFTLHIRSAVEELNAAGVFQRKPELARIVVEPPRDAAHGDLATNAAMVLAKEAGSKPRDLAEQIAAKLRADDLIA